jgi:hypothetical protein
MDTLHSTKVTGKLLNLIAPNKLDERICKKLIPTNMIYSTTD